MALEDLFVKEMLNRIVEMTMFKNNGQSWEWTLLESLVGQAVEQSFKFTHGDKLWSVAQPELTIQSN